MRPTINVVDLFHGDNQERVPDFAAIKAAGVLAVIHKASQGRGYVDPRYTDRKKAALDAGLLWGAYHFLDASPPQDQADHFLNAVHGGDFEPGSVLLACDFERWPTSQPTLNHAYQFMRACDMDQGASTSCVLYSGDVIRETCRPHVGGHQNSAMIGVDEFMRKHRLWLAQYGPTAKVPWPWNEAREDSPAPGVWLWQWTETGNVPGCKGHVDGNYFAGTPTDLATHWVTG